MGAHNAATLTVARRRIEMVRDTLSRRESSDTVAHWWADVLDEALVLDQEERTRTLRAWMEHNHGEPIDTLQVNVHCGEIDRIGMFWTPGSRRIDATRVTRVVLDGSSRDYAGVTTFAADERTYVGFAKLSTPDRVQMLVYAR